MWKDGVGILRGVLENADKVASTGVCSLPSLDTLSKHSKSDCFSVGYGLSFWRMAEPDSECLARRDEFNKV